eukprot:TRINITY_DN55529_c0_g1_i1.p1 TRINITY_DN55529_c0_g1~~TRINITY_DN55529_c0_g1_i1.p1  ORF type:complete len:433 (-),score=28.61 TRINITY_DN55529_c0_g1_i1:91-1389(-)
MSSLEYGPLEGEDVIVNGKTRRRSSEKLLAPAVLIGVSVASMCVGFYGHSIFRELQSIFPNYDQAHGIAQFTESASNASTIAKAWFVPKHKYPNAKCLDGTAPVVYIRRGGSKRWLIFLEGWGMCYSLEDCLSRSHTSHGSTKHEDDLYQGFMDLAVHGPFFSANEELNPLLHDFNWVFVRYCDGGYFAGDRKEPVVVGDRKLWFRGRYIREAVVDYLRSWHGMDDATDVIVSGCSSGGVTTLFSIQAWHQLLDWVPNVRAFADSGFFLDVDGYAEGKRFLYDHMNPNASLNPECVRAHLDQPWKCFLAQYALPYTKVPVFVWQSRYDSNQIGDSCDRDSLMETNSCKNSFGVMLEGKVEEVLGGISGSYFIDGCWRHCSGQREPMDSNGVNPTQAIARWYYGATVRLVQIGEYPCPSCCHPDSFCVRKERR